MAITKAEPLAFVNDNLNRSETAAKLAVPLQTCLNDLSNINFLTDEDTAQTLVTGTETLDYPTLYKQLEQIILNDGSVDLAPLKPLPGGYQEYRELMRSSNAGTRSNPTHYAEYGKKFYLYPVPGNSYTVTIKFYKYHDNDVDTIEFTDEFRNAVNFGAAFYVAMKYKLHDYISLWGSNYANEKELRRLNLPEQPQVVNG